MLQAADEPSVRVRRAWERGRWYWAVPQSRNQIPIARTRNLLVSTPIAVIPPTAVYSK
jgi:hypothetical protein